MFLRLLHYIVLIPLLLPSRGAFAADPAQPVGPVAELYEHLRVLNGDANDGPVICFPEGVSSFNPDGWSRNIPRRVAIRKHIETLRDLLLAARQASGSRQTRLLIRVIGHADKSSASLRANLELSYRRARSVGYILRSYLSQLNVEITTEGRGQYEPTASSACSKLGKSGTIDNASPERRVEIEIAATSLTTVNHGDADIRLRLYSSVTMPGRTPSFVLVEGPLPKAFDPNGAPEAIKACARKDDPQDALATGFEPIKYVSPLDQYDTQLFAGLRAYPVLRLRDGEPTVMARLVLDAATAADGRGVPGYWALHERLPRVFDKQFWSDRGNSDAWTQLTACNEALAKELNKREPPPGKKFGLDEPDVLKKVLDDAPKDLHGIMLHAHRLDRNLHFFDVHPGMGLTYRQVTGEFAMFATSTRAQPFPGGPFELSTKPDPIDPCAFVPKPRRYSTIDATKPLSSPLDVAVSDPFLAYMLSAEGDGRGFCPETDRSGSAIARGPGAVASESAQPGDSQQKALKSAAAATPPAAAASTIGASAVAKWDLLGSQLGLEAFLQSGVVRVVLPLKILPNTFAIPKQEPSDGIVTLIVAAPTRERLDQFIASAYADPLRVETTCNESDPDIGCGILLGGASFSPSISISVQERPARHYLGTRLTHVLPAADQARCFARNDDLAADWPANARLQHGVDLRIGDKQPLLIDRHDCRLLGVLLPEGSSVSW